MWKSTEIPEFDIYTLEDVMGGKRPAVRLSGFADAAEIDALAQGLIYNASRTGSIEQVTRLGISQYEQGLKGSKSEYFRLARLADLEFAPIFARSFSPVRRFIERLQAAGLDADIMSEPGYGYHFAGCGKLRTGFSPIHVDYAPQDSSGWAVGEATSQLAWNLYLQIPGSGGELLLWDKLWQPADDRFQVSHSYYYDEQVVAGAPMLRVKVKPGEVLVINSRNFHAVSESSHRLAFGSFISGFSDGTLRLWS